MRSALSALEGYHGVLWLHSRTEIICSEINYEISKINVRCKEINIYHILKDSFRSDYIIFIRGESR